MQNKINMITLGVDDLPRSVAFYQRLGFPKLEFASDDVAFFTLEGCWLGLYGRKALANDAQIPFIAHQSNSFALAQLYPSESEVDQAFSEAIHAGGIPTKSPQKVFWGGYSGYFQDPDGHLWELAHNPFMNVGQ